MFSAATEVAGPNGWRNISGIGGSEVFGWGSPDEPPRLVGVEISGRRRPLLCLEARSGAKVETTGCHDLRIDSQMTGPQVMAHGEIARRMMESSSYRRKSIYSFPEVIPDVPDCVMPGVYRNSAARRVAMSLPYLVAVSPVTMLIKFPTVISSLAERRVILNLFESMGLVARMDGQTDRPFLRVEMASGEERHCPDILLAKYVGDGMREVFDILFERGVGRTLTDRQRGWWHMMSAHLGIRAVDGRGGLHILRHRQHSLRCPEVGEDRNRVCYEVDAWGLPLLLTRIRGSAPVLVPVR